MCNASQDAPLLHPACTRPPLEHVRHGTHIITYEDEVPRSLGMRHIERDERAPHLYCLLGSDPARAQVLVSPPPPPGPRIQHNGMLAHRALYPQKCAPLAHHTCMASGSQTLYPIAITLHRPRTTA